MEVVVGGAIGVVADLLDEPPFFETLEPPTVVAVDEDLAGPSGVGPGRIDLVHAPDLVAPHRSAFAVDAPVGGEDGALGIRYRAEEAVQRRHGGVAAGEGAPNRAGRGALPPRLGLHGHFHGPAQPKTKEATHHSIDHDGKFVTR